MNKVLIERPMLPFLLTALFAMMVALFFLSLFPQARFDLSIYNHAISIKQSAVWLLFSAYLFLLGTIYYVISSVRLRTKKWLVLSHYVFIVLFLIFFALFSSFANRGVQKLISGIPLTTLITLYGTIFVIDALFFLLGLLMLVANLLTLKKSKMKN
jgi:hypothetical protein